MSKKLTFILPLTLKERRSSGRCALPWRSDEDQGVLQRTYILLASFIKNFRQDDLSEFIIVCPDASLCPISALLRFVTEDPRYRVISELSVCPVLGSSLESSQHPLPLGWFIQQVVKLAMSHCVSTEYYVTLDNDVVCVKPFSYNSLVRGGKALINLETPRDYSRLYVAELAKEETRTKYERYKRSAALLGYIRPSRLEARFYGETPVVFHAESVRAMTAHIEKRFARNWCTSLLARTDWTECSLYYQYLEMISTLRAVARVKGCNHVLDLEKSVWHQTALYKRRRLYDCTHFLKNRLNGAGYFVAVQSWLQPSSWLPSSYSRSVTFYDDLERWLLPNGCGYSTRHADEDHA